MRCLLPASLALAALATPLWAEAEEERGYIEAFLEDNLSTDGLTVKIDGLEGALTSQATIDSLTIADSAGIWLTLSGLTLDWDRAALLSGNLSVNSLSADKIDLLRLPLTPATAPEASGPFALPELPVSVMIGAVTAETLHLGAQVLGQEITARLGGSAQLSGGEGQAQIDLTRTDDGPDGTIRLQAAYANATDRLTLSALFEEEAEGIAASLLNLPGRPDLRLAIDGDGPLGDFAAEIALDTGGEPRLHGTVTLRDQPAAEGSPAPRAFEAQIAGNLAPLFLPEYAAFFGDSVALDAAGLFHPDGAFDLSRLNIGARAITLAGQLSLAPGGLPKAFDLTGTIALPDGTSVLLPLSGDAQTRVTDATLSLAFDASQSSRWTGSAQITGLDRPDLRLSQLALTGDGQIADKATSPRIDGTLSWQAEGLSLTDAALGRALGSVLWGGTRFDWDAPAQRLRLTDLTVEGEEARLTGDLAIGSPLAADFLSGKAQLDLPALARFSALAGRPLDGAARLSLSGTGNPLTGGGALVAQIDGKGLRLDQPELDRLLSGDSRIDLDLRRDETGLTLNKARLAAKSLVLDGTGQLSSDKAALDARLSLADFGDLGPRLGGTAKTELTVTGSLAAPRLDLTAETQNLVTGQADLDKLLRGPARISLKAARNNTLWQLEDLALSSAEVTAKAKGQADGQSARLTLDGALRNLGLFLPEYAGKVTLSGGISQENQGYGLDLSLRGPGGIDLGVKGKIAKDFATANLALKGRANAALANPFLAPRSLAGDLGFDLGLNGPLALTSISGPIVLRSGRLVDPGLPFALNDMAAELRLASGRAQTRADAQVSTGGSVAVQGSFALEPPFQSDLGITLSSVRLRDPALYDIPLEGQLALRGPLLGSGGLLSGRIAVGKSELRIPSTGLSGATMLKDITHRSESAASRQTRKRAGLLDDKGQGAQTAPASTSNLALDVTISAPSQIFLRGRGLDAELGGELGVTGTLSDIRPEGGISLIRGRLDILGRRMELTRANITLEGGLVPALDISADTETTSHLVSVTIEGPASDPRIGLSSSPELPEEEVLAALLFDRDTQSLSPFQALQLADAIATLAGRGGEGMMSRLRQGSGLDNLDIRSNAAGETQVTAGKYLTEKVYSEIQLDQSGKSQINLNLDLNSNAKLRARMNTEGSSGIGIVVTKDY